MTISDWRLTCLDRCGLYLVAPLKKIHHGLKHALARIAGHKTIAIDIWPDSSHLQNGRFRKVMPHRKPDGFLHSRFHAIGYQYDVKSLPLARLIHFLQAAS